MTDQSRAILREIEDGRFQFWIAVVLARNAGREGGEASGKIIIRVVNFEEWTDKKKKMGIRIK